jgi:hypothetical protein
MSYSGLSLLMKSSLSNVQSAFGVNTFSIVASDVQLTLVLSVAILFVVSESGVREDTRAVLVSVVPELAVSFTVNIIVTELPFAKLPSAQCTVPVPLITGCEHVPRVVVTLWYVVPDGTVSVTVVALPVSGPLFST